MNITEFAEKNGSLYDFGEHCKEIRDICMDFELCPKVHTMISVKYESIKLFLNDLSHRDLSYGGVKLLIC